MALLVPLLVTAACARTADTAGDGAAGGSLPDDQTLVIRVTRAGGFVPPAQQPTRVPTVSVYGDGQVITEGPQTAQFPPPALPNLQTWHISTDDVAKLVARAREAGVGGPTDLGSPGVSDAPSTRISVWTPDGVKTTEAYALMEGAGGTGLTADQQAARKKLLDLVTALTDLPTTLGADAVGTAQPYKAADVAGIATPWTPPGGQGVPEQTEVAWPGPALPGQPMGTVGDLTCVVAEGQQATAVTRLAGRATTITPWTYGGKRWSIGLRPLLPDESACADLQW